MSAEIRVCLVGASGRMGREIISAGQRYAEQTNSTVQFVCGLTKTNDPSLGKVIPGCKYPLSENWQSDYNANVVCDYSSPEGTVRALETALKHKLPILIGTTGHSPELLANIARASETIPVIKATNTSVGVTAMNELVAEATRFLGAGFDVEIVEAHHRNKVDAPSGTALTLAEKVAEARGISLAENRIDGRSGETGVRSQNEIGIHAVRGGDVVGEHTVYFIGEGQRLEITYRATNRAAYADGAIRALNWLVQNKHRPGMYSMLDVIK
jgi:4-hydroxy-tetrahydrodipicolinate reductase